MPSPPEATPPNNADHRTLGWHAYSRWPTSGLVSGFIVGLMLGFLFNASFARTIGTVVGLAVAGCLGGVLAARVMYPRR